MSDSAPTSRTGVSRRSLLRTALLFAGSSTLLAACGGAAQPGGTTSSSGSSGATGQATTAPQAAGKAAAPAPAKQAGSIKYQQRQSAAEDFVRKTYAPKFQEQTGVQVVLEDIPDAEVWTKIPALFAARQLGDLVFGWNASGQLASWAFRGISAPLDDFVKSDNYDLTQFYDGCITACRFEDKLHALPTVGHPGEVNLFYNKDMFDAAGIPYPDDSWTLDKIAETAVKLTKDANGDGKVDQFGYASGRSWFQLMVRLRAFGGDLISEDGKKTLIASDGSKAALQWEHDMNYKHKAAPAPTEIEGDVGQMFTNGKTLAIVSNNVANVTLYKKPIGDKFKWGVQPWPVGPSGKRGATVHVNTTHITSQAKEPKQAWEFLKLICGHDAGVEKVLMGSGSPGGRPDVWGDKRLIDFEPWYAKGKEIMKEAQAPNAAYNLRTPEVDTVLIQRTGEIWLNKVTPAEGAATLQKEIQEILDQPR